MANNSGLVISQIQGVTIVNFRYASIVDSIAVETIARELYEIIDLQARRKLLLDFAGVKFLSSTMVGVLLELHRKSKAIDAQIVICGLRSKLKEVFRVTKLHKLLDFAENEEEAFNQFCFAGKV